MNVRICLCLRHVCAVCCIYWNIPMYLRYIRSTHIMSHSRINRLSQNIKLPESVHHHILWIISVSKNNLEMTYFPFDCQCFAARLDIFVFYESKNENNVFLLHELKKMKSCVNDAQMFQQLVPYIAVHGHVYIWYIFYYYYVIHAHTTKHLTVLLSHSYIMTYVCVW